MTRFEGAEAPSTNLDAILWEDFDALRETRDVEDARIEGYTASLTAELLGGTIAYVNNERREFRDPLAVLLTHFFNHQTHHRGQVTAMFSQTEVRYVLCGLQLLVAYLRRSNIDASKHAWAEGRTSRSSRYQPALFGHDIHHRRLHRLGVDPQGRELVHMSVPEINATAPTIGATLIPTLLLPRARPPWYPSS